MGRAAADERHVYYVALDYLLCALDRGDGALRWKAPLSYRPTAGPVVLGGYVIVAGSVVSLPAFNARTGAAAGTITFPARLVALPLLGQSPTGSAFGVAITGSLENKWDVSLFEPSPFPTLPLVPLTELPGEVVVLPTAPSQLKG